MKNDWMRQLGIEYAYREFGCRSYFERIMGLEFIFRRMSNLARAGVALIIVLVFTLAVLDPCYCARLLSCVIQLAFLVCCILFVVSFVATLKDSFKSMGLSDDDDSDISWR